MEALIAALISGGLTLIGTVITVNASNKKTENAIRTELAVMKVEVQTLRKEVEKHNNFAVRVPRLETAVESIKDTVGTLQGFHMH